MRAFCFLVRELSDLVFVVLQVVEDIVDDRETVRDSVQHKIPVGQEVDLSVSERVQARVIAKLQASRHMGQDLNGLFKAVQYIGWALAVLLFKQQILHEPFQVFFRILRDHHFIVHTFPSYR